MNQKRELQRKAFLHDQASVILGGEGSEAERHRAEAL
jgi:hypothetical protein